MNRLAISSLAWKPEQDSEVAEILKRQKISAIELAPTKLWPDLTKAPAAEVLAYRQLWEKAGFEIVALQSLVFGRPDLLIFGPEENRRQFIDYLKIVIDLGVSLGARNLVFGSPKNRTAGSLSEGEALEIAVPFFRELGDYAAEKKICLCVEPNAREYACDFIWNAQQGLQLVAAVDSEGFGLHLDLACMQMEQENLDEVAVKTAAQVRHFHISRPQLGPVEKVDDLIEQFGHKFVAQGYQNFFSVEMRDAGLQAIERVFLK